MIADRGALISLAVVIVGALAVFAILSAIVGADPGSSALVMMIAGAIAAAIALFWITRGLWRSQERPSGGSRGEHADTRR